MRLKSLNASNVFSLGQVSVDLDRKGLVLVTGHSNDEGGANGAGKSSLANKAVLWCLFGQTAGGLRADEVVNRHTAPPCFVEISFQGSDGKDYTIKRSRKPAALEFHCGEDRLTQRNENETQELINRALGRNYETFVYSDFFGQGREDNFLSLSPRGQKAILERILPIAQVSKWAQNASDFKSAVATLIQSEDKAISFLEGGISKLKDNFNTQSKRAAQWGIQHKSTIRELEEKITSYEHRHKVTLRHIEDTERAINSVVILDDVSDKLEKIFEKLTSDKNNYLKSSEVAKKWLEEVNKYKFVIGSKAPGACSYCGQNLPKEVFDTYNKNLCQAKDRIITAELTYNKALESETYWRGQYLQSTDDHRKLENIMRDRRNELSRKALLETDLADAKKLIDSDSRTIWKAELSHLQAEVNPYSTVLLEKELEVEVAKLEAKNTIKTSLLQEGDRLAFWQNAFGKDIKIFMLDRVCPFLTERVSKHLEGLGNSQIKVTFSTTKQLKSGEDRDEFTCDIRSSSGGCGYDSLSGGEQQIVSFAIGLALGDLAESQAVGISRILILDEPFVSLDSRNAENLINYLVEISGRRETILLISNEESLKALVPANIHVRKINGITTIE